jgi:diguanylate cyclase (GGDEF)-like protein
VDSARTDARTGAAARWALRRWVLWSLPRPAVGLLLGVEVTAVAVTLALVLTGPTTPTDLVRGGLLTVLAIGYAESAARVEQLKRYLRGTKVFANQVSVWALAAVLTVSAGWAAVVVALIYAHIMVQRHREQSGPPYRVVFTAAAVMLSVLAASGILHTGGGGDPLRGGLLAAATVLVALLVCTLLNFALLLAAMWLTVRPPRLRVLLPDVDALGYEVATLLLGVVAAEFLLHTPLLTPIVVVLAAFLHRSSLVNALHRSARTDTKTGLLNLAAWSEHARGVLSRAGRNHSPAALLFCDLDHFKTINDTHGHLVGDQVIIAVAGCLRREVRDYDGLARFGGEEFLVLLDGLDHTQADAVAHRVRAAISALPLPGGLHVTASIGLAHHTPGDDDLDGLLERADTALRHAKNTGRNTVRTA